MKLTEQQLFDYIYCPVKYDIKYNKRIDITDLITMPMLVNAVVQYFFSNLVNGKVMTYEQLKKKWDNICEKHEDIMDSKKAIAGWATIVKVTQWAEQQKLIVGDVNVNYSFPVNDIVFCGTIDAITVTRDKKTELLTVNLGEKTLDKSMIDMKLKHTMDYIGFKTIYGVYPDGIKNHSVKYDQDLLTLRSETDIIRLKDTISSVGQGIDKGIFYPRESFYCSSCSAKSYCKYWKK